jgi:D-alanyl-D-alanine dipeptidase
VRRARATCAWEREGFTVEPNEWWHFNFEDWKEHAILDIPFSGIN